MRPGASRIRTRRSNSAAAPSHRSITALDVDPRTRGGGPGTARFDAERIPSLGQRNERLLTVTLIGYAVLVVAIMFERGVALTPDVIAVAFLLVAVVLGRGRLFLRDWVPFIALLLAYEMMRGIADDTGVAVHVEDMVLAERILMFGAIPTQLMQDAVRPAADPDPLAMAATVVYMLHFALPLVTGYVLWIWRRSQFYDFVAALIVLSMAGFVTYLLIPAAPPWYAADAGALAGPDGAPVISYLKPIAFEQLAEAVGFDGRYAYSFLFGGVNPNPVAAFPSLHVAYPFLTFLALRRAFGRIGWLGLGYTVLVVLAVTYTGDHWIIDAIAGIAYAYAAFYAVVHLSPTVRTRVEEAWTRAIASIRRRGVPAA